MHGKASAVLLALALAAATDAYILGSPGALISRASSVAAPRRRWRDAVEQDMFLSRVSCMAAQSPLRKALQKRTGALTVSLEYERMPTSTLSENDLSVISMQLRKSKAAALFAPSLDDLGLLSKEQKKAKGDFPGPCPVVYYPPLSTTDEAGVEAARDAGADAVVLRVECLALASAVARCGMDVIWDCRSPDEISTLEAAEPAASRIVLLPGADVVASVGMLEALPADALAIASVDCQNDEVTLGRAAAKAGVKSVLVRQACIGDLSWDVRYGQHVIQGLTSKANPEFNIVGMSKGGGGDGRQSYGASAEGRAAQDRMSTQKDIMAARGGSSDPFPNHPGSLPPMKTAGMR